MRLRDTLHMSMGTLLSNKLRSVLTLVGIIAGVASIIAVMTAISVVQSTMEREMSVLGAQTFQVQKWPAGGFHSDADCRRPCAGPAHLEGRGRDPGACRVRGFRDPALGLRFAEYKGESTN
jgi:putative ABC transport system permease protein